MGTPIWHVGILVWVCLRSNDTRAKEKSLLAKFSIIVQNYENFSNVGTRMENRDYDLFIVTPSLPGRREHLKVFSECLDGRIRK